MESGIHPSLHPNCHYQIIYAKFKLRVYYPPPNEREVWHYQNGDSNVIKKAITDVYWEEHLKTFLLMKKSLFLIKLLKTNSQTIFLTRQLQLTREIHPGLTTVKSLTDKAWRL